MLLHYFILSNWKPLSTYCLSCKYQKEIYTVKPFKNGNGRKHNIFVLKKKNTRTWIPNCLIILKVYRPERFAAENKRKLRIKRKHSKYSWISSISYAIRFTVSHTCVSRFFYFNFAPIHFVLIRFLLHFKLVTVKSIKTNYFGSIKYSRTKKKTNDTNKKKLYVLTVCFICLLFVFFIFKFYSVNEWNIFFIEEIWTYKKCILKRINWHSFF